MKANILCLLGHLHSTYLLLYNVHLLYVYCTYAVAVVAVAVFPDAVFSVEVLSKYLRKRKLGWRRFHIL